MRKWLAASSRIVMPDQKKRSSFDKLWNKGRAPLAQNSQSNVNHSQTHKSPRSNESKDAHHAYDDSMISTTQTLVKQQTTENFNVNEIGRVSTFTVISDHDKSAGLTFNKRPVLSTHDAQFIAPRQSHTHSSHRHTNGNAPYSAKLNVHPLPQAPSQTTPAADAPPPPPPPPPSSSTKPRTQQAPVRSALSAQLAPEQQNFADSDKQSGMIQSRNAEGLMVFKQLPYSKKTHMMVHVFVEIQEDTVEHVVVHFNKHITVQHFLDLLKNDTNDGAFRDTNLDIFCADDEGDLDDDFPPPGVHQVVAELNIKNFYIKIKGADEEERDHLRRSTLAYKGGLQSTDEADKLHHIDEDEDDDDDDEDEYEDDDEDEHTGLGQSCGQCRIL